MILEKPLFTRTLHRNGIRNTVTVYGAALRVKEYLPMPLLTLNERLWVARQRTGWEQREVSLLLKVRQATVSDWEKGKATPGGDSLQSVCRLYAGRGVSSSWIMTGDGPVMATLAVRNGT